MTLMNKTFGKLQATLLAVLLLGCGSGSNEGAADKTGLQEPESTSVDTAPEKEAPEQCTFAFYYTWYGNTELNGSEIHWSHEVIKGDGDDGGETVYIEGKDNIASNFYPQLGNYSSTDPALIARHMEMMAQAHIDVVAVTWWGKDDYCASALPVLFDEARKHNLKVCFHIEPYPGRGAESLRADIAELVSRYGHHPAFYKQDDKPWFFIYDSYLTPAAEWARVCSPEGDLTIRGTEYDARVIGLWVQEQEEDYFLQSGLDGFYTYFAATGFTYGSTPAHWQKMQEWAAQHGKLFVPCVGPGYIDTRIRPWNASTTRDRREGEYYKEMFRAAAESGSKYIGITSFNEWHEGTQIEPAIPFSCEEFQYLDYSPAAPDYYLTLTATLISNWKQ